MVWRLLMIVQKRSRILKRFPFLRNVFDGKKFIDVEIPGKVQKANGYCVMITNTSEPAWQFQHSVDCNAPRQFAWNYWTNIANWNDPPATFHLEGAFDAGSQLTTSLPGQTFHSVIRDVIAGREAIIEMVLADAILSFHWEFEPLSEDRTRITQKLTLSGPNAGAFVAQARLLEQGTPEGMKKLVAAIEWNLRTEQR